MDDILTTANKIHNKIKELEEQRENLLPASFDKAKSISEYDKAIALTELKLRNGLITEFEGVSISNLPVTLIRDIAKGICYQENFNREIGESNYKAIVSIMDAIKAEMNGLQSINKHIE